MFEPPVGIGPTTSSLPRKCSTNELRGRAQASPAVLHRTRLASAHPTREPAARPTATAGVGRDSALLRMREASPPAQLQALTTQPK